PSIPKRLHLPGDESPVFFHACFHHDNRSMTRIRCHELLSVRHDHAHRPPCPLREEITERQVHERALASEVTANGSNMNDDLFGGHADRIRQTALRIVRHLVAHPDMDDTRLLIYRKYA